MNTKDILLNIVKKTEKENGVDQEVKINKKKGIKENNKIEGVKTIGYDEIRNYKVWKVREKIEEWKSKDFAIYFILKFQEKINPNWSANRIGFTVFIGRIKDRIDDILGLCDNVVLKGYFDFFLDNWAKYYFLKRKVFSPAAMLFDEPIKDFVNKYDYNKKEEVVKADKNREKELELAFLSSGEDLILEFGLIETINWLIDKKLYDTEKAIKYISGAFRSVYNKGDINRVINKTKSLVPYPKEFKIKNCDEIIKLAGLTGKVTI